jgi:hypothetical protein
MLLKKMQCVRIEVKWLRPDRPATVDGNSSERELQIKRFRMKV